MPFDLHEPDDIRAAVRRARRYHDRMRGHALAVHQFDLDRRAITVERLDFGRNGDVRTELLRLHKRASRQRLTGDAGRKAEIVFDPRPPSPLSPRPTATEHP